MNKKDMVKVLFDNKILISPGLLKGLEDNQLDAIINNKEDIKVVVEKIPSRASPKPGKEAEPAKKTATVSGISVKVKTRAEKKRLSPEDFVRHYSKKFEALQKMLLKKTDAVSINKIGSNSSPIAVIGMVKEMRPNGFLFEDPTGEIEVSVSHENKVSVDDVIAVKGFSKNGRLLGREIIFPDIPLTHPIDVVTATLLLSHTEPKTKADVVCLPDRVVSEGEMTKLGNPAWVSVTKEGKTARLLVYKPKAEATLDDAVGFLRKRVMPSERVSDISDYEQFTMEEIPDVFWLVSGESGTKIYKGVIILSCGGGAALIDLASRKTEFVNI